VKGKEAGTAAVAGAPVPTDAGLKQRIIDFAGMASLEITAHDQALVGALAGRLAPGTTLYVAHTPHTTVRDVAETACLVERAGFEACPHIVARRIAARAELVSALARMRVGGVSRALLVAGDTSPPAGEFDSTLAILDTGELAAAGFTTLGVPGFPEGNPKVDTGRIWDALQRKQAYAVREGVRMHIVSQFGFHPTALVGWDRELTSHGITLPVHVGVAGPASLKSLAKFAMLCGIGASLGAILTNPAALGALKSLVKTVDEIFPQVVRLREGVLARHIAKPHFFGFGGVMKTVAWLEAVRAGRFELDQASGAIAIRS
jgi:methylenetetrahydrofolate reductase (NADH)